MTTPVDRVHLVRHGRTALNADGRLRGLADPALDDVGLTEVARLAEVLAAEHPAAVASSRLQRAVATAGAIAAATGIVARIDDRLDDRDYRPWTGAVKSEVIDEFGSVDAAPGVEGADVVAARSITAFDALVDESPPGPIVLVSHDAILRPILPALEPSAEWPEPRTASWTQLSRVETGWHVELFDQKDPTVGGEASERAAARQASR